MRVNPDTNRVTIASQAKALREAYRAGLITRKQIRRRVNGIFTSPPGPGDTWNARANRVTEIITANLPHR